MREKQGSPFLPGSPVPEDLFVGRMAEREILVRYACEVLSGKQQNVFLMGDRGIGKSSLASFVRYYLSIEKNILGLHVSLGRVKTLAQMVHHIFEAVLKETRGQSWFEDIRSMFGKHIGQWVKGCAPSHCPATAHPFNNPPHFRARSLQSAGRRLI
jgi:hypothetical protein